MVSTLSVTVKAESLPFFTSINKNPDGTFTLDVLGIINSTYEEQYELIKLVNNMLAMSSDSRSAPLNGVFVTAIVKFLDSKNETIKHESAKTVFSIASNSTESVHLLVQEGTILPLLNILRKNDDIFLNGISLNVLTIIIQNDFVEVNEETKSKIVSALIDFLETEPSDDFHILVTINILTNMFKNMNHQLSSETVNTLLPYILTFFKHANPRVASDSCFALGVLTLNDNEKYHLTFENDAIFDLLQLSKSKNEITQLRALMVLGNIVGEENDEQIQYIFNHGILESIKDVLKNPVYENVLLSSNFFPKFLMGSQKQKYMEKIIQSEAFAIFVNLYANENIQIQMHIAGTLMLITHNGNIEHILMLQQQKLLPAFCNLLIKAEKIGDKKMIFKVLAGIYGVTLKAAQEHECLIFEELEKYGVVETVEQIASDYGEKDIQIMVKGIISFFNFHHANSTCLKRY
uniref:Uncharacterized protein n=1 Tax=Panagrolaimus sp. ES5 TaxID=591445 RepID=A0AC34F2N4_9BILA